MFGGGEISEMLHTRWVISEDEISQQRMMYVRTGRQGKNLQDLRRIIQIYLRDEWLTSDGFSMQEYRKKETLETRWSRKTSGSTSTM